MKTSSILSAAVLLAIFGATAVNAQSLKIRERQADEETSIKDRVDHTNKTCETSITFQFNWKDAPEAQLSEYSSSSYCDGALGGIRRVCETPLGKEAVKQKIKSVTCGFGGERAITLKDGAIDYKINFSSSNDNDFVEAFLKDNL